MSAGSREYPARPIVGVGAVVYVTAEDAAALRLPLPGVILVRRGHQPLAGEWSLPGGTLEVGETLVAAVAREVAEETGLIVDVGPVIEVFDRIMLDDDALAGASIPAASSQRVRHHYVLIDYLCRPTGGTMRAGSDVSEAVVADPRGLAQYAVTAKVEAVVARALEMRK
jgi:8-oxo-dGTP diphosphatase